MGPGLINAALGVLVAATIVTSVHGLTFLRRTRVVPDDASPTDAAEAPTDRRPNPRRPTAPSRHAPQWRACLVLIAWCYTALAFGIVTLWIETLLLPTVVSSAALILVTCELYFAFYRPSIGLTDRLSEAYECATSPQDDQFAADERPRHFLL